MPVNGSEKVILGDLSILADGAPVVIARRDGRGEGCVSNHLFRSPCDGSDHRRPGTPALREVSQSPTGFSAIWFPTQAVERPDNIHGCMFSQSPGGRNVDAILTDGMTGSERVFSHVLTNSARKGRFLRLEVRNLSIQTTLRSMRFVSRPGRSGLDRLCAVDLLM